MNYCFMCSFVFHSVLVLKKDTGVISPNGKICLSVEIKEDTEKDGFGKVFLM